MTALAAQLDALASSPVQRQLDVLASSPVQRQLDALATSPALRLLDAFTKPSPDGLTPFQRQFDQAVSTLPGRLLAAAATAPSPAGQGRRVANPVSPALMLARQARDADGFAAALRLLMQHSGKSQGDIRRWDDDHERELSKSTISRMVRKVNPVLVGRAEAMRAFVLACGAAAEAAEWVAIWERLRTAVKSAPHPAGTGVEQTPVELATTADGRVVVTLDVSAAGAGAVAAAGVAAGVALYALGTTSAPAATLTSVALIGLGLMALHHLAQAPDHPNAALPAPGDDSDPRDEG
ncbi:hypothetical protein [Actinokineospora bangkokensis]|uniref:Uncharacterized protein n=1 Tax=Actinokineospora bangkokensis TaxID=1193682 RepID=A0A1Q9LKM6_9PSEU|nr:hypothetical protein [Actinokineospora bangkokensis]OLR92596.1 hypothetical protein BJP25_21335 [Actinokineospora bangkokensis]